MYCCLSLSLCLAVIGSSSPFNLTVMAEEPASKRTKTTTDTDAAASLSAQQTQQPQWRPIGCDRICFNPYDMGKLEIFLEPEHQSNLPNALFWAVCIGRLDILQKVFENPQLTRIALSKSLNPPIWGQKKARQGNQEYESNCLSPGNIRVKSSVPGLYVPLLTHACEHGHADIVNYFIEQGANINIFADLAHYSNLEQKGMYSRTPLLAAIRGGFDDISCMLIERGAVLTPLETKIIRRRSSDSFYGKEVTVTYSPLSWATSNENIFIIEKMLDHGLLNTSKAQFENHTIITRKRTKKQELQAGIMVANSIQSEILTLWECIVGDAEFARDGKMNSYMKILEILGQAGVILAGLLKKVEEDLKKQAGSEIRHTWRRKHFNTDGKPADHVVAIIRGMRSIHRNVLLCCGYKHPTVNVGRHISPVDKSFFWRSAVESAKRLGISPDEKWRKPLDDVILLAAGPWSRKNHHLFPVAVRKYVRDLLWFGALLERRMETSSISKVSLSEIYEDNVVPFIVG